MAKFEGEKGEGKSSKKKEITVNEEVCQSNRQWKKFKKELLGNWVYGSKGPGFM